MNRYEAITLARAAARQHGTARRSTSRVGYALAVHGSLRKLARAIAEAIGSGIDPDHLARHIRNSELVQAHGRRSWAFYAGHTEPKDHGWYVDLSVMPRL